MALTAQMFCLRNGVGDEERKEEEGAIFEFLFCASALAGRGTLVHECVIRAPV